MRHRIEKSFQSNSVLLGLGAITLFLFVVTSCSENPASSEQKQEISEELIKGESADLGDCSSNVWALMFTGRDSLSFSIGLNIPVNVIADAQSDDPDTITLNFPDVVREDTAVQYVEAFWPFTLQGSEPILLARFFLISREEAGTIEYSLPSEVENTIRPGIHQDELVYYELMITQTTLLEESDTPLQIPQPAEAQIPEVVPTDFIADFQEENNRYAFTWEGLNATP
ncbi:MAG TPA: hypothetical protein VKA68_01185 [bacterium]|nr:hypothetical protein [bacterium]